MNKKQNLNVVERAKQKFTTKKDTTRIPANFKNLFKFKKTKNK